MAERDQIDAGVEQVRSRLGPPTVLVNNAGVEGFDPFLKISLEKWNRLLAVNLTGTFQCCQAVVPDMIEAGWGRIVNISSSSAQGGQPLMTHYVASKAGVIGFTKALALELGPLGITVNTIPPGFIDTPMLRASEAKGLLGEGLEHHAALTPGAAGRAAPRTSPRPARSWCPTRPATSPARSSASTAGGTPGDARGSRRSRPASGPRRCATPSPRSTRPPPATRSRRGTRAGRRA